MIFDIDPLFRSTRTPRQPGRCLAWYRRYFRESLRGSQPNDSSQAYEKQKETDAAVISLFKQMSDLYSFVNDVDGLADKIERLERTIVRVLEQTTECGIFFREYTGHGFICKLHHCTLSAFRSLQSAARLLGQAISNRAQVASNLSSALGKLQEDLNSGVVLHTAFVSSQTRHGVDRLGKSNQS